MVRAVNGWETVHELESLTCKKDYWSCKENTSTGSKKKRVHSRVVKIVCHYCWSLLERKAVRYYFIS